MNPGMLERIRQGGFVKILLEEDTSFTGYIGVDPTEPDGLRMDGYVLSETGHLQQISISLVPEDIQHVQFLPEPPDFIDREGTSVRMEPGFFPEL